MESYEESNCMFWKWAFGWWVTREILTGSIRLDCCRDISFWCWRSCLERLICCNPRMELVMINSKFIYFSANWVVFILGLVFVKRPMQVLITDLLDLFIWECKLFGGWDVRFIRSVHLGIRATLQLVLLFFLKFSHDRFA